MNPEYTNTHTHTQAHAQHSFARAHTHTHAHTHTELCTLERFEVCDPKIKWVIKWAL